MCLQVACVCILSLTMEILGAKIDSSFCCPYLWWFYWFDPTEMDVWQKVESWCPDAPAVTWDFSQAGPSLCLMISWDEMGVSKNRGTPKWMVYSGNPIKIDDLGVPLFLETPKCIFIQDSGSLFAPHLRCCCMVFSLRISFHTFKNEVRCHDVDGEKIWQKKST